MKTKQDLIKQIHANSDISKAVIERVVQDFVEALHDEIVSGNEVRISELGTFKISKRKAHEGHNPSTGEVINIPEKRVPQLKFNTAISRELNKAVA